ncbi:MAG: Yip1 family protein [Oscillospiraceae bacterium]|nr:Yip1 family protein [Oscillospiraceae bacterium]MDY2848253.1 Yip1 family protein [Oscillospiraceae bacterium]
MLDLTKGQFVKHVLFHPFEGFEDLRWKKGGSMRIAVVVLCLLFVEQLAYDRMYGFQYSAVYDKVFNIVPYIFRSFIIFLTFVVANWAMCTLFDGEGSMKNIFIDTAYSLIPYVVSGLVATVLSHLFVEDEYIFISAIEIIGTAWTVVLFLSGMKAVHQFSFGKTLALLLLTVLAMIAILFLLILLLTLFQQVLIFIFSIYTELSYRLRV